MGTYVLSYTDFKLQHCLFGLHQPLEESLDKTIGLVESAKSVIVLTAIYPKLVCLATCGVRNLNIERLTSLHGRKVILFSDTDEKLYTFWQKQKEHLLQKGFQVRISELLYNRLTPEERSKGYDLADALLNPCLRYG